MQTGQLELQCTKSASFLDICGPGARSPYPVPEPWVTLVKNDTLIKVDLWVQKISHYSQIWLKLIQKRVEILSKFVETPICSMPADTKPSAMCSSQHVWSWVSIGVRLETCNRFVRGQLATLSSMSRQVSSEGNIMPHQSWSNVQLSLAELCSKNGAAQLGTLSLTSRCWAWCCVQPTQNTFTPPHIIAGNMHTGVEHNNVQIAFFTQRSVRCSWLRYSQNYWALRYERNICVRVLKQSFLWNFPLFLDAFLNVEKPLSSPLFWYRGCGGSWKDSTQLDWLICKCYLISCSCTLSLC